MNFIVDCIDPLTLEQHYAQERSLLIVRLIQSITKLSAKNAALRARLVGLSS